MPGVERLSVDLIVEAARQAESLGIPAICLFPYTDPALKTQGCEEAWSPDNLSNRATRAIRDAGVNVAIMTDVALDPYNINGHDGIVRDGIIVNDESVEALVKMALAQVRAELEAQGFKDTAILSYAAKYASAYYGPFRDAVGATGALTGDKKTYQMNPANGDEALRIVARDLDEGADMVMVKPGQPYLDICRAVKDQFGAPTFAYQVSGEYAMLMAAGQQGWIDDEACMMESLIGFKRAGCDGVLSYFAPRAAALLNG